MGRRTAILFVLSLIAHFLATHYVLRVLMFLAWYDPKDVVLETRIYTSMAHVLSVPLLLIVAYATPYPVWGNLWIIGGNSILAVSVFYLIFRRLKARHYRLSR